MNRSCHNPKSVTVKGEWLKMNEEVQWLQEYARTGSPQAFARLVEANLGVVYSAAMRQLRDHHLAEDVTQQAFIKLARKASSLKCEMVPAAWLLVTVRYLAGDARRAAARRANREQKAAQMRPKSLDEPQRDPWEDIEPLLDEALCSLSADDRRAVTLRYLQGRNVEQVAAALEVSRDAAAQRLHRAIGRLRDFLHRRGAVVDRAALGSLMLSRGFHPPPPALAASIVKSAAAVHAGMGILSNGATMAVVSTKVKLITTAAVLALTLGGTATVVYKATQSPKTKVVAITPNAVPSAAPSAAPIPLPGDQSWRPKFNQVYSLAPGEVLKHVPTPFIPERNTGMNVILHQGPNSMAPSMGEISNSTCVFNFEQQPEWSMMVYNRPFDFMGVAQTLTGLRSFDFEGLGTLGALKMPGDWVRRPGTPTAVYMAALQEVVARDFGRSVRFVPRTVERDVLVASGAVKIHSLPKEMGGDTVAIYADKRSDTRSAGFGMTAGSVNNFLGEVGELAGLKAIDETTPKGKQCFWHYYVKPGTMLPLATRERVLKNITDQTGISFKVERRPVEIWFVESPAGAQVTSPLSPVQ